MAVEWEVAAGQIAGSLGGAWVLAKALLKMFNDERKEHMESIKDHITSSKEETKACNERYKMVFDELMRIKDAPK